MTAERSSPRKNGTPNLGAHDVTVGDEKAGFEVYVDRPRRVVRLRMWGFWDAAIGEQFHTVMLRFAKGLDGRTWGILADSRQYPAQTAKVAEVRKDVMKRIAPMGCKRIGALVTQAVYSMQFTRIATESHVASKTFHDEAAALDWVADHDNPDTT
jgi:hypothetical protein